MNRSILIVIADFLLVSLLAFSSFDKLPGEPPKGQMQPKRAFESVNGNQDLVGVLKGALEDERRVRDQLANELTQTQESVREQQNQVVEREKQNQAMQQNLQAKDQQSRRLEQERLMLLQQFAAAQTNLQTLQQQLKATAAGAQMSQQKLELVEAQLRKEQERSALTQQQLARLETTRKALEQEKSKLAEKLVVTETEKRATGEKLAMLQGEVQTVRTEKAQILQHADKLAEGVTTLAQSSDKLADRVSNLVQSSGELTKEVREYRPMAANAIFNQFATNRVHAKFHAFRTGMLGLDLSKHRETETVLATDGTNAFALCHVEDTPLALWSPGTEWEKLAGTLDHRAVPVAIDKVSFYLLDPRVIMIPVTAAQAQQLGTTVYPIAADPFKFQDAVLVGGKEGYYGECKFQIDLTTPQYVKMDRSLFRGIFGKFNPSRGDLVFTKTGELLGIMANSTYCIVMHNFTPSATIQFGDDVRSQNTGEILSRFHRQIMQLPLKLQ